MLLSSRVVGALLILQLLRLQAASVWRGGANPHLLRVSGFSVPGAQQSPGWVWSICPPDLDHPFSGVTTVPRSDTPPRIDLNGCYGLVTDQDPRHLSLGIPSFLYKKVGDPDIGIQYGRCGSHHEWRFVYRGKSVSSCSFLSGEDGSQLPVNEPSYWRTDMHIQQEGSTQGHETYDEFEIIISDDIVAVVDRELALRATLGQRTSGLSHTDIALDQLCEEVQRIRFPELAIRAKLCELGLPRTDALGWIIGGIAV